MRNVIRRVLTKCFGIAAILNFKLRHFMFGFNSSNKLLERMNKNYLIPILKSNGATIGNNCDIESGIILHNCDRFSNLAIGDNCHIGKNCFFDLREKIIIQDNVTVSMQCTFLTHTDMGLSSLSVKYPPQQAPIIINDNCYIGAGVIVLSGCEIGAGAIIGAGAVVVTSVDPGCIVGGIPAVKIT
jgi:acetyltransferase-like isoleucine patch superfamily enzyme